MEGFCHALSSISVKQEAFENMEKTRVNIPREIHCLTAAPHLSFGFVFGADTVIGQVSEKLNKLNSWNSWTS